MHSVISYQLSALSSQLSALSFQLSAFSSQPSALSYQLSAFSSQPSATFGERATMVAGVCFLRILPERINRMKQQLKAEG
jgi:hypothetical protein